MPEIINLSTILMISGIILVALLAIGLILLNSTRDPPKNFLTFVPAWRAESNHEWWTLVFSVFHEVLQLI
jgi:hypothetical protein